jgi:predicted transcriptional regulator
MGFHLGKLKESTVSKEELQSKLGKSAKIASTRLGELVKTEAAVKTADEKYRITSLGVFQLQKEILARIKAKIGV